MKTNNLVSITLICLAIMSAPVVVLSMGGPINPPPGPPGPTMKSLDIIEPRTALVFGAPGITIGASGEITISAPGSYYLTENLDISENVNGIWIQANGVTVDLMGHAIRYVGEGNAQSAILIDSSNVSISNGHIISPSTHDGSSFSLRGFSDGVKAVSDSSRSIRVQNVSVRGVRESGINLAGTSHLIEDCSVHIAGMFGIRSIGPDDTGGLVRNCFVKRVFSVGIFARTVQGCRVEDADFDGIIAQTVSDSYAVSNHASGIVASISVSNSYGLSRATQSHRKGIFAETGNVTNSSGISAGGHGISADIVIGSSGHSTGNHGSRSSGIRGNIVNHSSGQSSDAAGGPGIKADRQVSNSFGHSEGSHGIDSLPNGSGSDVQGGIVVASNGISNGASSGDGIFGLVVSQSTGWSSNGYGIRASIISHSFGRVGPNGRDGLLGATISYSEGQRVDTDATYVGIRADRAIGSRELPQGSKSINYKFLMP